MRSATEAEYCAAVSKARGRPERMFFGKPDTGTGGMDVIYKEGGVEIARKTVFYKRGKVSQTSYMVAVTRGTDRA